MEPAIPHVCAVPSESDVAVQWQNLLDLAKGAAVLPGARKQ